MFANGTNNKLCDLNIKNKYEVKDYVVNIEDKCDSHSVICQNVTVDSEVLEVGFGQGAISKCLIKDKSCVVDGIDVDEEAIRIAREAGYFRNLYDNDTLIENKYDYIIFADVLEHIYDPIDMLKIYSKYLKKGGEILISIPNVSYYDIIAGLINNNFNYDIKGLLDNTHIRFFTLPSFMDYINESNKVSNILFDCEYIQSIDVNPVFHDNYKNLDKFFSDVDHVYQYQHIIRITKVKNVKDATKLAAFIKQKRIDNVASLDKMLAKDLDSLLENECIKNHIKTEKESIKEDYEKKLVKENNEHIEAINKTNEYVHKLEQELDYILNSKSWKITKPLRSIMTLFRKR